MPFSENRTENRNEQKITFPGRSQSQFQVFYLFIQKTQFYNDINHFDLSNISYFLLNFGLDQSLLAIKEI